MKPRVILPSTKPCPRCGTWLSITHDAIGRPRERCPQCQGVNREPEAAGTVGHLHRQTAKGPHDLGWDRALAVVPAADPVVARRCDRCAAPLPVQITGRPRLRCADRHACDQRARGAA
ncbi:MAG: hypothetical protein KF709_02760 [Gemmatimonadaceae bacterium]|nr:hypothetical protein [Gemmatimonadaceae bacterium]